MQGNEHAIAIGCDDRAAKITAGRRQRASNNAYGGFQKLGVIDRRQYTIILNIGISKKRTPQLWKPCISYTATIRDLGVLSW